MQHGVGAVLTVCPLGREYILLITSVLIYYSFEWSAVTLWSLYVMHQSTCIIFLIYSYVFIQLLCYIYKTMNINTSANLCNLNLTLFVSVSWSVEIPQQWLDGMEFAYCIHFQNVGDPSPLVWPPAAGQSFHISCAMSLFPKTMNPINLCDTQIFSPLVPPCGSHLWFWGKFLINYWTDYLENVYF